MNLVYKTIKHSSTNRTSLLNDDTNYITIIQQLRLVELHSFNRNTANSKYFYYDILTEFYSIIMVNNSHLHLVLSYDL